MLKIGILVSGGGTNLQAIINSINSGFLNAKIVSVISNRSEAYALERAKDNKINHKFISKKQLGSQENFEKNVIDEFEKNDVELVILAGFMLILTSKFINHFKNKIINVHPSLIPSFCGEGFYGLNVHKAVLQKGVKVTGATVHFVTEAADEGPIILQKVVDVFDSDTPEVLQKRVMEEAEWEILPKAIKLISENKIYIENNVVRGTRL